MEMMYLGKSGLKVSRLCLGTMTFGGAGFYKDIGQVPFDEAKRLVDMSIDAGINFFDTADTYSNGLTEEILGKAFGSKRKNVIITTKVCQNAGGTGPNDQGLSRLHIIESVNDSLKRLKTDYIDIYMAHDDDPNTSLEEILRTFDDLVRWGKVRYIGCSNFSAWVLMKALSISEKYNLEKFINFQGYYCIGSRELEYEHIPLCINQGLGITTYSPLGGEFFTGLYRRGKPRPEDSRRNKDTVKEFFRLNEEKGLDIVEKLDEIAKHYKGTVAQCAINYLLSKRGITSVIIGVNKIEHLQDNLGSIDWKLNSDEIKELDAISESIIPYPYWRKKYFGER